MTELLWWLALASLAVAVLLDAAVGGTAALVAAVVAMLILLAASMADLPGRDRRPW